MNQLTVALICLTGLQTLTGVCEAVRCYSCQYSDGPGQVGYECVASPADYNLGPNTVECENGCQVEAQSINKWQSIWYLARGCRTKPDGCTSGAADICVETCDNDLCNDKSFTPSTTVPTGSTESTTPPTTTTEIPGTRWCYSCVYSYHPDVAPTCVTDAANAPPPNQVRCPPSRVCTIFRQWDKGEQVIRSFARGCEEQQGRVNGCSEDTFFETCLTFCTDEYCNSGDGTHFNNKQIPPLPVPVNG